MPTRVECRACRKAFSAPDSLAGRTVKCSVCKSVIGIPEAKTEEPPSLSDLLDDFIPSSSPSETFQSAAAPSGTPFSAVSSAPSLASINTWPVLEFIKRHVLMTIVASVATVVLLVGLIGRINFVAVAIPSFLGFGVAALGFRPLPRRSRAQKWSFNAADMTSGQKMATGWISLSMIGAIVRVISRLNRKVRTNSNLNQKLSGTKSEEIITAVIVLVALVGVVLALVMLIRRFGSFRVFAPLYLLLCAVLIPAFISLGSARPLSPLNHAASFPNAPSMLGPSWENRLNSDGAGARSSEVTSTTHWPSTIWPTSSQKVPAEHPLTPHQVVTVKIREMWADHADLLGKIRRKPVWLEYSGEPGSYIAMYIYYPVGFDESSSERKWPCVMIAPSGSNLLSGTDAGPPSDFDCLPWAKGGYVVVLYSLDGAPGGDLSEPQMPMIKDRYTRFSKARAGLANFEHALAYVRQEIREVDQDRIAVFGHSTAGTLALLIAESNARVKACLAFAPCSDVPRFLGNRLQQLEPDVPGVTKFAADFSPNKYIDRFQCPLFLFHADDDVTIPVDTSIQFAKSMTDAGKQIDFVRVPLGDQRKAMLRKNIPLAIAWLDKRFKVAQDVPPKIVHPDAPTDNPLIRLSEPRSANTAERKTLTTPALGDSSNQPASSSKTIDYAQMATESLRFRREGVRNLIQAMVITGSHDLVLTDIRLAPALKKPVVNLAFILAVESKMAGVGGAKNLENRDAGIGDRFQQLRAERAYRDATGDIGQLLIEGLQVRLESGDFGNWGKSLQPRPKTEQPGLLIAQEGNAEAILAAARHQKADVLISATIDASPAAQGKGTATLRLRIVDVAKNTELWKSKTLSRAALAAPRKQGEDPAAKIVEAALAYIDESLKLKPIPNLKPEAARKRVTKLVAGTPNDVLAALTELRYYQAKDLISAAEAEGYYSQLIGAEDGRKLASDDGAARQQAIAKLVSKK